jgi:hypothetical protein
MNLLKKKRNIFVEESVFCQVNFWLNSLSTCLLLLEGRRLQKVYSIARLFVSSCVLVAVEAFSSSSMEIQQTKSKRRNEYDRKDACSTDHYDCVEKDLSDGMSFSRFQEGDQDSCVVFDMTWMSRRQFHNVIQNILEY